MKRLIELRAERNLTQEGLAQKAGVSTRIVHKMEHGQPVQQQYAEKVLQALGVRSHEVADLMFSKPTQGRVNRSFVPWRGPEKQRSA